MFGGNSGDSRNIELSVVDLDLRQWALLDMLIDGAGIRYVLDGPTLWIGADRLDDVLSIIDAVRSDELAA